MVKKYVGFILLLSNAVLLSQIPLTVSDAATIELFEGATVALFSPDGYCMGLVAKDGAYIQSFAPGLWATATETDVNDKRMRFIVTRYVGVDGHAYIGFKSEFNGNFLQAVPKVGVLACDYVIRAADQIFATEAGSWAQFVLDPVGDGTFYLQSRATGGYIRQLGGRLLRTAVTVTGHLAGRSDASKWTLHTLVLSPRQVAHEAARVSQASVLAQEQLPASVPYVEVTPAAIEPPCPTPTAPPQVVSPVVQVVQAPAQELPPLQPEVQLLAPVAPPQANAPAQSCVAPEVQASVSKINIPAVPQQAPKVGAATQRPAAAKTTMGIGGKIVSPLSVSQAKAKLEAIKNARKQ